MNYLEPEKVEANMIGKDYHGIKVRIKIICQVSEIDEYLYKELKEYDESGNLPFKYSKFEEQLAELLYSENVPKENSFYEFFGTSKDSYLVAVEEIESGEKYIYPYGDHGVYVSAWKGSDKLKDLNHKTGIFEHLKNYDNFC